MPVVDVRCRHEITIIVEVGRWRFGHDLMWCYEDSVQGDGCEMCLLCWRYL